MLPLNLQDAKGSQREQVIWYWANLFGVVTRLKPGDIEWESFLMDTTRSLDFRDPGYLTYPDPHSDQNYKSWQPYQRQLEEMITLNDKQWTLPRERGTKKELETQKREKGSAFGAIRESLYYLNIALNRFLVLGYGLAPVDLSHFNTRVAVFRMTPWQFWERILGPRVQFTSPFRVKGPPAAYQSNAAAVLLYYSLLWDMHKETHPAVANALEEPPISIQEMYQLCYESISMAHHEEAQMRIGYKEKIGGENIPAGRWSAFLWRMHIEDMKLSLGETKAPLVPFRRGETTDWPFAADRYDLRITIQGLRTPAFDRFSTAWKPNPPNIGSGQKARVLQTEQHFDQYENGGWNSPHAASDTEPQEEQQVTPPAMKEVPKQVETDNFLRKPKIIVSDTPRKASEASDSAPIIQVTSTVPIKFESYFSTDTKRKAAWYEEGRINDINPDSVKALKWLVDTHVNREYNTTNRLPKEIHINFGSLLSSALVRGFHTDMEAVLLITTAALDEEEMGIITDKKFIC